MKWDGTGQQVIITTGKEMGELDVYFFVYNSEKVDASDLNAIRGYVSNFRDTYNVLFDAAGYETAAGLYDALRPRRTESGKALSPESRSSEPPMTSLPSRTSTR